jgi:acid phosphatase family membrane protein YuiD
MKAGIFFGNRILDVAFIAWFIAQIYKVLSTLMIEKRINWRRFVETGGMPSSHSSTVTSLVTSMYILHSSKSSYFALTFVFAGIVMYDATGIRRAAGRQAGVLNKIAEIFSHKFNHKIVEENLKELLGHTPVEVGIGAILGIIVALVMKPYLLA